MWVRVNDTRVVDLKKASQIRRTRRGYRVRFGHPWLTVSEDDPAFGKVHAFIERFTAEPQEALRPGDEPYDRKIGGG